MTDVLHDLGEVPLRLPARLPTGRRRPVAYLVNQYPAVSHSFIRREIQALEQIGVPILRHAIRAQPHLADPRDVAEKERTCFLLQRPGGVLAGLGHAGRHPARSLRALGQAARMMPRSHRPPPYHVGYFIEACALARRVAVSGAVHIHAHFGTNSAEIALLAARMAGVGFSFTVHGPDEFDKPEFLSLGRKIAQASFVATVSDYGRSQLWRWCEPHERGKIHVVRCGLDFRERGADSQPSGAVRPRFVNVGRLCPDKAQHVFIEAIERLVAEGRDVEAVMVGDGGSRGEIESLIRQRGLADRVRLAGWLGGDAVREEIRGARALVVSSFAENLPVVIMEAMAEGRPVVATWIAGIPELVADGETGWLVPPGSVEALADAMRASLDVPPAQGDAMAERCRAVVRRRHDVHVEAGKLAMLFPER